MAQPYEDMYINVFKTLAYLEQGKIDGFATAEALRQLRKAEHLRDVYGKYMQMAGAQDKAGVLKTEKAKAGMNARDAGQFVESPLGAYLSCVTFMEVDERNNQELAARRLVDAVKQQQQIVGPVKAEDFEQLARVNRDDVNVLVVALTGRGPIKTESRLRAPLLDLVVDIPYPRLSMQPSSVTGAMLEVEGSAEAPGRLALVEDMASVSAVNYRRAEPAIYSRTLVRVAGKLGLVTRFTNDAMVVDPTAIRYRHMRDTTFKDNIQANDEDQKKGQWLTRKPAWKWLMPRPRPGSATSWCRAVG